MKKSLVLLLILITNTAFSYDFFSHMYKGTTDIPNKNNLIVLGIGGTATLAALTVDDKVHNYFSNHDRMNGSDYLGNKILGTGVPGLVLGSSILAYGLYHDRNKEINNGESHLEGLLASFTYTSLIKWSMHRKRPEWNTNNSFPSGHTSTMFTSAANIMETYGGWEGATALTLATYTGLCRLNANAHYLSDVIFGATLGYIVGYAYTIHHRDENTKKNETISSFIYPYFNDRHDFGIQGSVSF